jgi:hypothetical protein
MAARDSTGTSIPAETVAALRPAQGRLVDSIVAAVRAENQVYADVLDSPEGMGIRLGTEHALKSFLDALERGERPASGTADVWRRLGESEFEAGRSLESVRAAWRTGTLAAWRGAAELAAEAGIPAPTVIALAEAIFVFTDELGTDVIEGYVRAQSDEAGDRERRRRRLASLLLDPSVQDPKAIARAAELARWRVPQELAALALAGDSPGPVARGLDVDVLAGADGDGAFIVIPDPDGPGRAATIRRAVGAADAALGPTVPLSEAHRSLRWARLTLALVDRSAVPSEHPTRAQDHLAALIVNRDEELACAIVAERLAALEGLRERERERLLQTLASWLAHQRHIPSVAAELQVHPQTVRYRINKLTELLGDALERPEGRFELELALRAAGYAGSA